MGEVEQVCEELDKTLLELMDSLQQLTEARKKYNAAVSEGYFNMAKARYTMGPQTVGVLQYDAVMVPLVHVEPSQEIETYKDMDDPAVRMEFTVERIRPDQKWLTPAETASEDSQLRRRRPATGETVEELRGEGGRMEGERRGEGGGGREEVKDPLKWFGILVPQSLRQSQQYFIQAIHHSAELASVQVQVEELRRKYRKLQIKKSQLKSKLESQ